MRKLSSLIMVGLLALAGSAQAQTEPPAAPVADPAAAPADGAVAPAPAPEIAPVAAPAGTTYVTRGLTVGAGALQVTVPIVLNLSKELVLKPVWVPLDVRFGVNDQLDVFLSHNVAGSPLAMGHGGVCLGGTERGCAKLYNNLNLGAQFSFMKDAAIELSGIGALEFRSLDPMHLAIDLGIGFKYTAGAIAIKAAPQIGIAANKRDEQLYKEYVSVPVHVAFQATPELAIFVDTGIFGATKEFSKNYVVPAGLGAAFAVMPTLDVGAEFMLPALLTGVEGDKAFDMRTFMLFASYRTK